MIYIELFVAFFGVGMFSFGGAYGAIPLIRDAALSRGWLTDEVMSYMMAVSESTPGSIIVNLSTYVGNSQGGILGAIIATTAVTLPAFLCIIFVAAVFKNALENRGVNALLYGLRPCVIGIILATGLYISFQNIFVDAAMTALGWREILLTIILGLIMFGSQPILKKKASPIHLIIISAVLGIVLYA